MIFAIAEIAYTQTFPSLHGQKFGPDLFPRLIGLALMASGVLLVIRGVLDKRRADDGNDESRWIKAGPWLQQSRLKTNLLLVLVAMVGYVLFSDWLGFILSSMLILSVLLYRLGTSFPLSLLISTATTAVLQFTFAKLLLVPLPAGLLQGLVY